MTRVGLIKMDVQGAEGLVLAGAGELLKQPGLKIMMEFEPAKLESFGTDPLAVLTLLQGAGFSIKMIEVEQKRIRNADIDEVVEACRAEGYMNLLLDNTVDR